tara:strand:+ start:4922 stop:5908 length:987 start_codon:yes stop_codon:yes gene_type:complete
MDEIRPDLSEQSRKLYANQLNKIFMNNNLNYFNILKFITRLVNKAKREKDLNFILLDGSNQTKNQRLSAVRSLLEANKASLDVKKYNNLYKLLTEVGDELRNQITSKAGTNIKTENEEKNMTVTWNELNEFAENYKPDITNLNGMRNYLILNLMLNNYEEKDGLKYYVVLRVIEYASLYVWINRRPPPDNKQNYLYLHRNELYIQHSKTTGGIRRVGNTTTNQRSVATYPLNKKIKEFVLLYIKKMKIKNNEPLFLNDKQTKQIDITYYSKILKELLGDFGDNMNSTMLRKIYENREIDTNLNANEKHQLSKQADHSLGIAETYYKKI